MIKLIDKFLKRTHNLDFTAKGFKDLLKYTPTKKIFDVINKFSSNSERTVKGRESDTHNILNHTICYLLFFFRVYLWLSCRSLCSSG